MSDSQSNQPELFDHADERAARTRSSMLWAAYGDALGFISELADAKWVKRRTRGAPLDHLMPWTRRVGGRGGVEVELPAGCWSDDTQLRTAVCRSISPNGFDVESFARVELPVWPSYALGGGRASKAAAANLTKADALWYANEFQGWTDAGGNGAAMRIQPHVWASTDLETDFIVDVFTNSICTHGHPRAIVGALFQAVALAHCLRTGATPGTDDHARLTDTVGTALDRVAEMRQVTTWLGLWEKSKGEPFGRAWKATLTELRAALETAASISSGTDSLGDRYTSLIDALDLKSDNKRGSGLLTSVAAVALAHIADAPEASVVAAANVLGSDTDTIATMAGALCGAAAPHQLPPTLPLDSEYLQSEADRLVGLARGDSQSWFSYPDLLTWVPPATQADALVVSDDGLVVEGLGSVAELEGASSLARGDFAWQWVRTTFGQTLLIKRRTQPKALAPGNVVTAVETTSRQRDTPRAPRSSETQGRPLDRGVNLDGALDHARRHLEDDVQLGYTLRRVARDGSLAELVAFVSALRGNLRG